jgi:hypothetical protein
VEFLRKYKNKDLEIPPKSSRSPPRLKESNSKKKKIEII